MTDTVVNLPAPATPKREIQTVIDVVPILDTARFEHMQRIANVMARSSMIPKTLCTIKDGNSEVALPFEQVLSNCFLVVNQAARWGMDPFAVISCCSVVHGRLSYEGKLVAAVLDAKLGVQLRYQWDDKPGEQLGIIVSGQLPDGRVEQITGTVADWKTTGNGSPWKPSTFRKMLAYRGAREWARLHAPAVMLGVYSDDELDDLAEDARARRSLPVSTLAERLTAAKTQEPQSGFSTQHIERETEAQSRAVLTDNSTGRSAPLASDQEPLSNGSGAVQDRSESTAPPDSNSSQAASPAQSETDTPAASEPADLNAAGNLSDSSGVASDDVEGAQAGGDSSAAGQSSTLPPDWQYIYITAMSRVTDRPKSLPNRHNEALTMFGSEPNDEEFKWITTVYQITEDRLQGKMKKAEADKLIAEITDQ